MRTCWKAAERARDTGAPSGYGRVILAFVALRDGEDGEQLLKRFQTSMQRSGILRELRNRRFFRSKGEQARLDKARSLRRIRRRQRQRR